MLSTFSVINVDDSGAGSLRQAIIGANAAPGANTIQFNIPGAGVHTIQPLSGLPAITDAITIDGYTQPGSSVNTLADGDNAVLNVELDGSTAGNTYGLHITAGNSTIRGLAINRFAYVGIRLENGGSNLISGNFIGTDATGTEARGNGIDGIGLFLSSDNVIGTNSDGINDIAERNIVSANNFGIHAVYSHRNVIAGNYVGTDKNGATALPNSEGIWVVGSSNTIGGANAAARNLASGNLYYGIHVQGNGGQTTGDSGSDNNIVQGNFVGTDVLGQSALPNGGFGMLINSNRNIIGGPTAGARNIISSNGTGVGGDGLQFIGHGNIAQGNFIGTDVTGTLNLGNSGGPYYLQGNGISVQGTGNLIGGDQPGQGNLIVNNAGAGVLVTVTGNVSDTAGNTIRGNSITDNGGLGIDLTFSYPGAAGVTANDAADGDLGPNGLQNFPLIASAASSVSGTTVTGTLNSASSSTYTIDFYSNAVADPSGFGEGKSYLGSASVTTNASGDVSFTADVSGVFAAGQSVSATATDSSGSTSEFSNDIIVSACLEGPSLVVTTTSDVVAMDCQTSLREAINFANSRSNTLNPGGAADMISFNIPGSGVHTIQPLSALPLITDPVVIDGYTQAGAKRNTLAADDNAVLLIELNGSAAGSAHGLWITAGNSRVSGLAINRFALDGIRLDTAGSNVIEGNFIGTDPTGLIARGNGTSGIGGSGNSFNEFSPGFGIEIVGGSTFNLIGTDGNGTADAGERNVISANPKADILITGSGTEYNAVAGNFIGTNAHGTSTFGQVGLGPFDYNVGVFINGTASFNRIGTDGNGIADAAERNVISGHFGNSGRADDHHHSQGITIVGSGTQKNVVAGNFIGTDVTGTLRLANISNGVGLQYGANDNLIGSNADGVADEAERNIIAGSFYHSGVGLGSAGAGNVVAGNFIGTDVTGTISDPDGVPNNGDELGNQYGVTLDSTSFTMIGGTSPAARNLISGNTYNGVTITGAANVVQGNFVGTDVTGTRALPNGTGVSDGGQATNTIGGTTPGAGNLISGNRAYGVFLNGGMNQVVQGNLIGTDATGTLDLGNGSNGIHVQNSNGNLIGGTTAAARNVISGNEGHGIQIWAINYGCEGVCANSNLVQGNYIGTDATGTVRLGNTNTGVTIIDAPRNTIGGTAPGAGNLISGNGRSVAGVFGANQDGILIYNVSSPENAVQGNSIGLDSHGGAMGNQGNGVRLYAAPRTLVGGDLPGAGNVIANNVGHGVWVLYNSGNAIRRNSIVSNGGLGINLDVDSSVTPNDLGDADTGANNRQNFPVITSVASSALNTIVQGTLNSQANAAFEVEFFSNVAGDPTGFGEGQQFIGSGIVTTDATGNANFAFTFPTAVAVGLLISSTATLLLDTDSNPATPAVPSDTSEFSALSVVGSYVPATIRGTKFNDLNGNGLRDTVTTSAGSFSVPGKSDPWLAGMPDGSTASSGDVAPTHSPVLAPITIASGATLTFDVNGCVSNGPSGCTVNDPDRGPENAHFAGAENGISNVTAPTNSLIGVFLGPNQPTLSPAPAALYFGTAASRDFATLSPVLQQPFFIGDGRTNSSQVQQFVVPVGATRLYLGTMDGFGWFNNSGSFSVSVNSSMPEPPLENWVIQLDAGADGLVDSTTTTNANGIYTFNDLWPSTYRIREVQQPSWTQTTANPADITVTASGQIFTGMDFGNHQGAAGCTPQTTELRSRWQADGNTLDSVGNNDGSITGGVTYVTGKSGQAFNFDGSGYIVVPDDPSLHPTGALTIGGWIKPEFTNRPAYGADIDTVISKFHSSLGGFGLFVAMDPTFGFYQAPMGGAALGTPAIFVQTETSVAQIFSPTRLPDDGHFHYLAGTYDGAILRLYVDGLEVASQPLTGALPIDNSPLIIGADFSSGPRYSQAQIDDVTLYGRGLSPCEIEGTVGGGGGSQISGHKFFDVDGSGVQNVGEPRLSYWPFFLDTNNDGAHTTGEPYTYANINGEYSFGNLPPGTYRVREVQQVGWVATTPIPTDITITASGQLFADVDFGNDRDDRVTMITGTKFRDIDGNGTQNPGDDGLAYWPIFVDLNHNETYELGEPLTWTNFAGNYAIAGLSVGTYSIREIQQPGWLQSTVNPANVVLSAIGQTVSGVDFGNYRDDRVTLISGRKFFDVNVNGIAEPGEPGLQYWPIYLDNNGDNAYQASEPVAWTDWNGVYSFAGIASGIYRVREIQQSGWTQTSSNPADIVVTANGQTFAGIDFGNRGSGGIGGGPGPGGSGNPTDLEITKNAPIAIAGESITYTLRVTNKGPANSYGVILGDQLKPGLIFESATPSQGSCMGGQTIICAVGPLAVSESATVTIVAHVLAWVQEEVKNEACVYSTSTDTDATNNCAIASTPINVVADLGLVKTSTPTIAIPGQNLTYTLRVHNDGPSDSTNVSLEDELPPEVTFVSASSTQGSCSAEVTSMTTVICDLGTVYNGETAEVTIVVNVSRYVVNGALIINHASIGSDTNDPNSGNDDYTVFVPCGSSADLILTKNGPFTNIDAEVYYRLEVTNHGPSDSFGTFVGDHLPPDINFLRAETTKGTCNFNGSTNVLICGLGPMLVGETETVTVYVGVPVTVLIEQVRNEGIVWGTEGDPAPWNNHGGAGGLPVRSHVGVVKNAPPTVIAGETMTYTLHVTNEGPDASSNVIVGDTLPAGLVLLSAIPTQGSCYAYNPILCFLGALDVGQSADVAITVFVPPSVPPGTILVNTAFGYGGLDPWPGYGHADTTVRQLVDVELVKEAPAIIVSGTEMKYTLRARNRGLSNATNISLEDELPPDVQLVSTHPSQGSCSSITDAGVTTVSCHLGTIEPQGVATVEIVVFVPSDVVGGLIITNEACLVSDGLDTNLLNNCSSVSTTTSDQPDLELFKTTQPGPVIAGENIEYTLEVHNRGPSDARGVILGDTLPSGVVFVSASATQGSCSYASGTVLCDMGYLPTGNSAYATIVAYVPPSTADGTIIENTACVVECGHDILHHNDCSTVQTLISAKSVLTGIKFNDINGNGTRDVNELGIQGWQIFIDLDGDNQLDANERSVFTDASGVYRFTGLGKATWTVREVQNPGWLQTTVNPSGVTVTGRQQQYQGGDFGNKQGSLSGRVFVDADNDGIFDSGEIPIGGVTVTVTGDDDIGPVNLTVYTDPDGVYRITGLRPGAYRILEQQPAGYLDGRDTIGSLGGNPAANDQFFVNFAKGADGIGYNFGELLPSKLDGYVYDDVDDDGQIDFGEQAIVGARIILTGVDDLGQLVNRTVITDSQGYYEFGNLRPGDYTISEEQPTAYLDGRDTLGTLGGTQSNDRFSTIAVASDKHGMNYNFGEHADIGLRRGQTATIGYWQNKNGQALILSLNGGPNSTSLGNWLAINLPNMYGANAGVNNLYGKTNKQVADYYITLFKQVGQKLDAQVLATAFAVYATDFDLAGNIASPYGFIVNAHGTGAATVSVGGSGAAFGVANNTRLTIMQILYATNSQAVAGRLYNNSTSLRNLANTVYDSINKGGDLL